MRIERLAIKDVLRFRGETTLDLSTIPAGAIVSVVGPNGAGKTSLLEAVPGTVYRKLPSRRDGADPAIFARSRAAALDVEFAIDGQGTFRARVSMDGQTRGSDAVLEQRNNDAVDGLPASWVPLNDGKVSTYKKAIAERFPSMELFLTSAFAPQGKGDRLAKMTPGEGHDLFAEFLGLERYAAMAKTARQAVDRLDAARDRFLMLRDELTRETADGIAAALERMADEFQRDGGDAEVRKTSLAAQLDVVADRLATVQDKVAAFSAASQRVRTITYELQTRQAERDVIGAAQMATRTAFDAEVRARETKRRADIAVADAQLGTDERAIVAKRDKDVQDAATAIAGNQRIVELADKIRAAVAAMPAANDRLTALLADDNADRAEQTQLWEQLRAVERELAALVPVQQHLTRAKADSALLDTVPCKGVGEYAACSFLTNAAAAQAKVADYERTLLPRAAIADRIADLTRATDTLDDRLNRRRADIRTAEAALADHQKHAQYESALARHDERVAQLTAQQEKALADAAVALDEARQRHADAVQAAIRHDGEQAAASIERYDRRVAELQADKERVSVAIDRLTADLTAARADLDASADGNAQATALLTEQADARAAMDGVIRTLATVEASRRELTRRREDLQAKRRRLAALQDRTIAPIESALLRYQTLAKVFARDGLPAVEMDAIVPDVVATCNRIVGHCFGPRFTVDIVTQVEKADKTGMKDEFRIRVLDNDEGGDWRDLSDLSGGEKVIVCEALMNAIAITVNARSAMPIRTLWRDETGASLDKDNAPLYVDMLRKVAELGGIHHVFFVTHNADAAALADAQIRVADGTARIVFAPFSEAAA